MDEDLFNALAEISYFKHYQSQPQQYTTEIVDLRQHLLLTSIQSISITSIFNNHYTAYVYHVGSTILYHGDSLHQPPANNILDIISLVIAGLGHLPVDTINCGTISRQGGFNGGDGSCGIAALNFIESYADNNLRQGQGSDLHLFRDMALKNMIHYHDGAQIESFPALMWNTLAHISPTQSTATISEIASGYIDFNIYSPLNSHPIYAFITHEMALQC
ncbi:uncharacterized protein LACBIDRAFT_314599 [Laccaria bicolor S238N-H82]|uniref:Predicted protein n=1 Tax=Laccaria bicolor (strain S238N-H82 / ATCC MYA-4686) TaxID=486041 RepID=B0DYV8_LACBS|nr:uncharacterized protein LACBIDRAFT_314599 [Laccaria bicolor S238N-H82]EDR00235.1 predicted protein [Laccaria bicolor S238N-H82]|eukprot:XP_001889144.1 predicted protein [Laccaria bicolor S238N-H82]